MKKLIAVLVLLLGVQSYGIFGAMQAKRIVYTCTLEVGPLCYAWEENALVKALGPKAAEKLESSLEDAKKAWEKDFIQKFSAEKKGPLDEALEKAGDLANEGLEAAKKAIGSDSK